MIKISLELFRLKLFIFKRSRLVHFLKIRYTFYLARFWGSRRRFQDQGLLFPRYRWAYQDKTFKDRGETFYFLGDFLDHGDSFTFFARPFYQSGVLFWRLRPNFFIFIYHFLFLFQALFSINLSPFYQRSCNHSHPLRP